MDHRVESDDDHSSTTYAAYENPNGTRTGNGRRIVAVPIISGIAGHSGEETVLGIAAFFLNSLDYGGTHGNEPFCATYIGSYTQGANTHSGGGSATVSKIRLVSNR